jgi:hemoglobin-like flavoprotein
MTKPPAFADAALIEESLELFAEACPDPVAPVYERLFSRHPEMAPYFWRDTDGAIKGEMLSRTFAALLDFVGERLYAGNMIATEMVTHEGYDVPREIFSSFFAVVRDTVRDALGPAWTPAFDTAWTTLLADIAAYADATPRSDVESAYHTARVDKFQRGEAYE